MKWTFDFTAPTDSYDRFIRNQYVYDGQDVVLDLRSAASEWRIALGMTEEEYYADPFSNAAIYGLHDTVSRHWWAPHDRPGETSLLISSEATHAGQRWLEAPDITTAPDEVLWMLGDNLNSIRDVVRMTPVVTEGVTNWVGVREEHLSYDSYGNVLQSVYYAYDNVLNSHAGQALLTDGTTGNDLRYLYTSQEYNVGTGMYYYNRRDYDPRVAKFLQEDPIVWVGGLWSLGVYVGNDPVNKTDPMGLKSTVSGPTVWLFTGSWTYEASSYYAAYYGAGNNYIQNAGDAHRALNRVGPAGKIVSNVLSTCEGNDLNEHLMQQGRLAHDQANHKVERQAAELAGVEEGVIIFDLADNVHNRRNRPPAQNAAQTFFENVHDFGPVALHVAGQIDNHNAAPPANPAGAQHNPFVNNGQGFNNNPQQPVNPFQGGGNAGGAAAVGGLGAALVFPQANNENVFRGMGFGQDGRPLIGNNAERARMLPTLPHGQFGDLHVPIHNNPHDLVPIQKENQWFVGAFDCDGEPLGLSTNKKINGIPRPHRPEQWGGKAGDNEMRMFQTFLPNLPGGLVARPDPDNNKHILIGVDHDMSIREANDLFFLINWETVFPQN